MTPVKRLGRRSVRLHTPDARRLSEAAMVLRQIAVSVDDRDETEHLNATAQILDEKADAYSKPPEKAVTEVAKPKPEATEKVTKSKSEPLLTE